MTSLSYASGVRDTQRERDREEEREIKEYIKKEWPCIEYPLSIANYLSIC